MMLAGALAEFTGKGPSTCRAAVNAFVAKHANARLVRINPHDAAVPKVKGGAEAHIGIQLPALKALKEIYATWSKLG